MRGSLAVGMLMLTAMGACGGGSSEQPHSEVERPRDSSVSVSLSDFSIVLQTSSAPQGEITFDITNGIGNHDLYVLRTDLDPGELPEDEPGTLTRFDAGIGQIETLDLLERGPTLKPSVEVDKPNLTAPEIDVLGSIEPMEEGASDSLTLDMAPGNYVLICNLVDFEFDKTGDAIKRVGDSHYELGMRTEFTVE